MPDGGMFLSFAIVGPLFFELFPVVLRNVAIKNRRPALGGRLAIPTGDFLVTRIHESHPRFVFHLDGTLASPLPGCRVHNGQLLMLAVREQPFRGDVNDSDQALLPEILESIKAIYFRSPAPKETQCGCKSSGLTTYR